MFCACRDLTFVLVLVHWIEKNELLSMSIVAEQLGLSEGSKDNDKKLIALEIEGKRRRLCNYNPMSWRRSPCTHTQLRLFNGSCTGELMVDV